jgi:hypothetical protein
MFTEIFQDRRVKLGVIMLALFTNALLPLIISDLHSLSSAWLTPWQPLFIFSNAATSYYMYSSAKWKWAGFFLLLLTAFSIEMHPSLHYLFAIGFFLSCLPPIISDKRLWGWAVPYLLTTPVFFYDLLLGELTAVIVLLLYHSQLLRLTWRLNKRHLQ